MIRVHFIVILLLLCSTSIFCQLSSSATASASVDIIIPVGAEKSGEIISGSFYPAKEPGFVVLSRNGMVVNGKTGVTDMEKETDIPSFHVSAGQYIYSITLSFDPLIINRRNENENIHIESFTIVPINEKKPGQPVSDNYSIGAIFQVGPSQVPGEYNSAKPYRVTINFN